MSTELFLIFLFGVQFGMNVGLLVLIYFSLKTKVDIEVATIWTRLNGLTRKEPTEAFDPDLWADVHVAVERIKESLFKEGKV